jgi:hypothetical protein
MMSDPNSSVTRHRSLVRLVDYSLSEASELGLGDVAQFLALASASLGKNPRPRATKKSRKKPSSGTVVSLAELRGREDRMVRQK